MGRFTNRGRNGGARCKSFCFACNYVIGYEKADCPFCGAKMRFLSHRARPPKKTASSRKWKAFWRVYPNRLTKEEKIKIGIDNN